MQAVGEFIKKNWLNLLLGALAAKILDGAFWAIVQLDWNRTTTAFFQSPTAQAAVLEVFLPVAFIGSYYERYEFKGVSLEPAFKLGFAGVVIGYCVVFAIALMTGNIEPLIQDMKDDPWSKIVILIYAVAPMWGRSMNILLEGEGEKLRAKYSRR